eukprot:comp22048_c0_seq1/m.50896 comp22048_c0_seq1/g.50896  ORF comp22048_c0_seq1/g.50896 comp22048_c0_seq1/m.50896 type:complete len:884 (+) comp22048_c0_seq1:106-2757(+)
MHRLHSPPISAIPPSTPCLDSHRPMPTATMPRARARRTTSIRISRRPLHPGAAALQERSKEATKKQRNMMMIFEFSLTSQIHHIQHTVWPTSRAFHDDLADLFVSLHDAHTMYLKPKCHGWQLFLPIFLDSIVDDMGTQRIVFGYMQPDNAIERYLAVFPDTDIKLLKSLSGVAIHTINGVDPLQLLMSYDTFISKDPSPRLNYWIQTFSVTPTIVHPLPKEDTVVFEYLDSTNTLQTLTLGWGAAYGRVQDPIPTLTQLGVEQDCLFTPPQQEQLLEQRFAAHTTERQRDNRDHAAAVNNMFKTHIGSGGHPPVLDAIRKSQRSLIEKMSNNSHQERHGEAHVVATAEATAPEAATAPAEAAAPEAAAAPPTEEERKRAIEAARAKLNRMSGSRTVSRTMVLDFIRESQLSLVDPLPASARAKIPAAALAAISESSKTKPLRDAMPTLVQLFKGSGFLSVFGFGQLKGGVFDYCIVSVPSFMPASGDEDGLESALTDIEDGIDSLSENGCRHIGIDVVGNPGGIVCLGYVLMSQLIPTFSRRADGKYDIIHADWMGKFIDFCSANDIDAFGNAAYLDPQTDKPYTDNSWYTQGPTYVRGGKSSQYSKKTHLGCSDIRPLRKPRMYYPVSRIALLSDGQCGSTCELFTQKLQNVGHVRAASMGGIWGKPMDPSSFAGGNVLDTSMLLNAFDLLVQGGLVRSDYPPQFKSSARMTFDFREMYSFVRPDDILEWVFFPAEYRIARWPKFTYGEPHFDADDYQAFVDVVFANEDESCEQSTSVPCSACSSGSCPNQFHVCKGGVIDTTVCGSAPVVPGTSSQPSSGSWTPRPDSHHRGVSYGVFGAVVGVLAIGFVALLVFMFSRGSKKPPMYVHNNGPLLGQGTY